MRPLASLRVMFFLLLLSVTHLLSAAPPLPALGADVSKTTVSGLSSGGFMAVQFHVAHSSQVQGAGILAGGPYYCARGSAFRAVNQCMNPSNADGLPSPAETLSFVKLLAQTGLVDNPEHLRQSRVWLFSGGNDRTVAPQVVDTVARFYQQLLPAEAVHEVRLPDAGHAMISVIDAKANECSTSSSPFINHCDSFDAAGELLKHLVGPLNPPGTPQEGEIVAFDQRPYMANGLPPAAASMATEAYVYIPSTCRQGGCKVHVAFHGCKQSTTELGRRFVEMAGYNRWAASNQLIVLYPQTMPRWMINPNSCWDWWGYSGTSYHTRAGTQIRAIYAMVEALGKPVVPAVSAPKKP